jgi:hypothetical protein
MSALFIAVLLNFHAIHITKTEINYNTKYQTLEISTHIFLDDLESSMKINGLEIKNIGTTKELANTDDFLYKYLKKKLNLKKGDKELTYNWVGKEISSDLQAVYCYLEVVGVDAIQSLVVQNNSLLDLYDDQTNIVETLKNNKRVDTKYIKTKSQSINLQF